MVTCTFCEFTNPDEAPVCQQCGSELRPNSDGSTESPGPGPAVESTKAAVTPSTPPAAPTVPASAMMTGAPADFGLEPLDPEKLSRLRKEAAIPEAPSATPSPPPTPVTGAPPPIVAGSIGQLPPGSKPKLAVVRGMKMDLEYPLYEGQNYIGRTDEKPVDIDLEDQESPERIWSSRQHALITFEQGILVIEDLNSSNGTFVNRLRVHPGERRQLQVGDVLQIGTVHLKLKL